jgi:hypothetical protein
VKRNLVDLGILAVVASGIFALALALRWTSTERTVDGYLLALGALAMIGLLAATREAAPGRRRSPFEQALRPRRTPRTTLPQLERIRRETALAVARAYDFHVRLRPTLRAIATHRLSSRRGVDLDANPAAARRLLGDDVWDLLRADRLPPEDRFAPGIEPDALARLLDRLERI